MKMCKVIKAASITLVSLIVVILAVIAVAINFVFTSEKLTPVVLQVANRSLNAKLDMRSVDLTFFSSFPRFGLRLTDGSLVSKAMRDTMWQKTDSLVSFKKCVVVINPIDYLKDKKINLYYVGLEDATLYAYKGRDGVANWDIALADTTAATVEDTVRQDTAMAISEININRVRLKRTNVTFDDRQTRVYANLKNANLNLRASLKKGHSVMTLKFDNENILFWQDGQLLANKIATEVETNIDLNRATRTLTLKDARLSVNGVELDVKGTVRRDTLRRALDTDLAFGLHAPSLETVLHMIPESILKKEEVEAQGNVTVAGTVKGLYGKDQMPVSTLKVTIKDASAKYKRMPYGIDNFEADFYAYVDLMRHTSSYADLKIFRFRGAHTEILADAKIQDLLGDPDITFNTKSTVDMTALAQTFPLQKGVAIEGKLDADLKLHCRLSSLKKQDLGRVRAGGKLNMKGLALRDSTKQFEFLGDASLAFIGNDYLAARLDVNTIKVRAPRLSSDVAHLKATVKSTNPQDTTRIVSVECKFEVNKLKGALGDSLGVYCQKANATVRLLPQKKNPEKPQVDLSLKTDTLFCRLGDMKIGMDEGGFGVTADKVRDSLWIPKGIIGFNRLTVRTPQFALPIRMRKTSVTVGNRAITLRNASIRIGHSNITASGAVHDLYGAMKHHRTLRANLEITSRNLDCNQLINSLNFSQDTLQAEVAEAETDTISSEAPMELFVIPKNIDFELQTHLKRVTYGKMVFENVKGEVDVRNQAIHLKNLSMRGLDADMQATMVYRARRKARGYAGFDFRLKRINIGKLVEFAPSLDTIVPMLRSFKGMVDFEAAAETVLDSALNIKIPSLRAAVHIKGDSLVLMDGETFAEISKKLLFKNKKRNVFDSISVNLTVDDGDVTIYPFVVQIDRYKAAVGGTQGLDMNFDYHISILKSPVPFKLGLNISGNLDDMKFRLGKAKYKDDVTPVAIRRVDSTRVNMGRNIVRDFEQVMNRSGGRLPKKAREAE